jgi:1,4-alpha-glucan branching enzyme
MTAAQHGDPSKLVIALHAHLPFTRPEALEGDAIESDWLFESVVECYVPLCQVLRSWVTDQVRASVFVSLSPTLLDMLADERLMHRCREHLLALAAFVERELAESADPRLTDVLAFHQRRLTEVIGYLDGLDWDVIAAFATLERDGACELGTTAATHAFLPLHPAGFVRAEISAGLGTFARHLGHRPAGMWLPERGVDERVLSILQLEGVRFTFVDEHCVRQGTPSGESLAPAATADGVTLFARHPALSAQVWSADEGYPGDPRYREFHRDRGYDVPRIAVLHHTGEPDARRAVGLKYHAITGKQVPLSDKAIYDPKAAAAAVEAHVDHFAKTL